MLPWVFRGLVLALFVYEGITLYNSPPGDTISELVWGAVDASPVIPFLAGLLSGHFFWPRG